MEDRWRVQCHGVSLGLCYEAGCHGVKPIQLANFELVRSRVGCRSGPLYISRVAFCLALLCFLSFISSRINLCLGPVICVSPCLVCCVCPPACFVPCRWPPSLSSLPPSSSPSSSLSSSSLSCLRSRRCRCPRSRPRRRPTLVAVSYVVPSLVCLHLLEFTLSTCTTIPRFMWTTEKPLPRRYSQAMKTANAC